jgi:hypothetical protein
MGHLVGWATRWVTGEGSRGLLRRDHWPKGDADQDNRGSWGSKKVKEEGQNGVEPSLVE